MQVDSNPAGCTNRQSGRETFAQQSDRSGRFRLTVEWIFHIEDYPDESKTIMASIRGIGGVT